MKLFSITIFLILTSCIQQETTRIVSDDGVVTKNDTPNDASADGTVNGGGGKGVMCDRNGVTTVETLDLYEAQVLYGLQSTYNPQNETDAMDLFANLMTKHFWTPGNIPLADYKKMFLAQIQNTILKNIKFISSDKKLNLTHDSFEPLIEQGCQMVQVAHYYNESILLIDQSLWNQMNWLNKVALLAHETVYFMDRMNGSTNSMASRKLVGQLFSTNGTRPKSDGVPTDETQFAQCLLSDSKNVSVGFFQAYNSRYISSDDGQKSDGLEFVFNYFLNQTSLFRTSIVIYKKSMDMLLQKDFTGYGEAFVQIDSYQPNQIASVSFSGDGKGTLSIKDSKMGMIIHNLNFSCQKNRLPPIDETQYFLKTYIGKFVEPDHKENITIAANGEVSRLNVRQVGGLNPHISYPTVCSYIQTGKITFVERRNEADRLQYMDYATHSIELAFDNISLTNELDPSTTSNPNCQAFLAEQKDTISKEGSIYYTYYSELLSVDTFRIHTSGGGDYVSGEPRTPSTLDEVYIKAQP